MKSNKRRIIVGGGLAGVLAALWCRQACAEAEVMLLEKSASVCDFLKRHGSQPLVLGRMGAASFVGVGEATALGKYLREGWSGDLHYEWLKGLNVDLWLDGEGVFGCHSAQAFGVSLEEAMEKAGIRVRLNFSLESMAHGGDGHLLWSRDGERESAGSVLFATGGERNHAFKLMAELGHEIRDMGAGFVRLRPASRPLLNALSPWSGIVRIRSEKDDASGYGELQISGRGLEGRAMSELSQQCARAWFERGYKIRLELDLLPEVKDSDVRSELLEQSSSRSRRAVGDWRPFGFEERFWKGLLKLNRIDSDEGGHTIKRRRLESLAHRLKRFPIQTDKMGLPSGERANYGGIDGHEVYPETLESRHVKGLYFAGEILDFLGAPHGEHLNMVSASAHLAGVALARP